jgi:hypothetical protein
VMTGLMDGVRDKVRWHAHGGSRGDSRHPARLIPEEREGRRHAVDRGAAPLPDTGMGAHARGPEDRGAFGGPFVDLRAHMPALRPPMLGLPVAQRGAAGRQGAPMHDSHTTAGGPKDGSGCPHVFEGLHGCELCSPQPCLPMATLCAHPVCHSTERDVRTRPGPSRFADRAAMSCGGR